jgi:TetR/AcrR family transcriptional regulator
MIISNYSVLWLMGMDVKGVMTPMPSKGGPRRAPEAAERKRDPERSKRRIIDAAIDEFARKGYAGARVADIAAAAGVNQQLISYYFGGKAGLAQAIGRLWRSYEAALVPDESSLAERVQLYGRAIARDPRLFKEAKLLAWEGLEEPPFDIDESEIAERDARLKDEVADIAARQARGEIDEAFDPAALLLILMSAGTAPAVYPQLVRSLFGVAADSPEFFEFYSAQLAKVVSALQTATTAERPNEEEEEG